MKNSIRTREGSVLTDLMLDLFKLNGQFLTAGDRLVAPLGLTSARWQILGTIVSADRPKPVSWIARDMGSHRQNVQRIVNDLEKNGLVAFEPNPHHKRASLVVLTDIGKQTFEGAMKLQAPWVNDLTEGLEYEELRTVHKVLLKLRQNLENTEA